MSDHNGARPALVYEGVPIRRRDEKLNLTDMWQAAGAEPARRPVRWLASAEGGRFVGDYAERHKVRVSDLINAKPGKGGGTFAHWQIGMEYARYLTTAFAEWCNETVRDVMEGQPMPAAPPAPAGGPYLTAADLIACFDAFGRGFRGETSAAVAQAVEPINQRLGAVEADIASLRVDVAGGLALLRDAANARRRDFSQDSRAELLRAAHEAGGMCPCCRKHRVTNSDGSKAPHTDLHHINGRWDNTIRNGIPICRKCHVAFTAEPAAMRAEYAAEIEAFHKFRERLPGAQASLTL